MEYDDFVILNDYSKMAQAYYDSMQKQGFVFMRLDSVVEKKMELVCDSSAQFEKVLKNYIDNKRFIRNRSLLNKINELEKLSQKQYNDFCNSYNLKQQQIKTNNDKSIDIVKDEAKLLKTLFELYQLEDEEAKRYLLKSVIEGRLDVFG